MHKIIFIGLIYISLNIQSFSQTKGIDSVKIETKDSISGFDVDAFGNLYYITKFSILNQYNYKSKQTKTFTNHTVLEKLNVQNPMQLTIKSSQFDLILLDNQLNLLQKPIALPINTQFSPTLTALFDIYSLWGYDPVIQKLILWDYRTNKIIYQSGIINDKDGEAFYTDLFILKDKIYLVGPKKIYVFDLMANLQEVFAFQEYQQIYAQFNQIFFLKDNRIYALDLSTKDIKLIETKNNFDFFAVNNNVLFGIKGKVVYLYQL